MDKNVENTLIALAEKLGTTVDALWNVLLTQMVLTGIMNATEALVYLALCATAGIWLKRRWAESRDPEYELSIPLMIWGTVSLFVSFYAIMQSKFLTIAVLNPEYAALMMLADLFNK